MITIVTPGRVGVLPIVTQTAHRCRWASASAFVDTFTRTMGQTPGLYRAAATNDDLAPAD